MQTNNTVSEMNEVNHYLGTLWVEKKVTTPTVITETAQNYDGAASDDHALKFAILDADPASQQW